MALQPAILAYFAGVACSNSARLLYPLFDLGSQAPYVLENGDHFALWQQYADTMYYQKFLQERFYVAMSVWRHRTNDRAGLLRKASALGPIPPSAYSMADWKGRTLVHVAATGIVEMDRPNRSFADLTENVS